MTFPSSWSSLLCEILTHLDHRCHYFVIAPIPFSFLTLKLISNQQRQSEMASRLFVLFGTRRCSPGRVLLHTLYHATRRQRIQAHLRSVLLQVRTWERQDQLPPYRSQHSEAPFRIARQDRLSHRLESTITTLTWYWRCRNTLPYPW